MTHYRSPQRLLDELGITEPEDIDIEAIAFHAGALIKYAPLTGCEARILGAGDRAIITVSEKASRGRQRFSASHELGHWMHDRNKARFRCTAGDFVSAWVSDDPERRANRYGADLLMPTIMIQPRINGKTVDFTTVSSIAEEFSTSLTAAAIRVVELNSLPAMLICTERHRRKWFVRSKDVPTWLWPREAPTTASAWRMTCSRRRKNEQQRTSSSAHGSGMTTVTDTSCTRTRAESATTFSASSPGPTRNTWSR